MELTLRVDLNISYKKPIPTPGPVLCRARLEKLDGKKLYVRGTIEDGAGTVYTVGDAMFIAVKRPPTKL